MGNRDVFLNEKITSLRIKHGLSQDEMAESADIKFRTYQNIEYGRTKKISLEDALKLGNAFRLTIPELAKNTEYEKYTKVQNDAKIQAPSLTVEELAHYEQLKKLEAILNKAGTEVIPTLMDEDTNHELALRLALGLEIDAKLAEQNNKLLQDSSLPAKSSNQK